jgi:hypothetical protein
MQVEIFTLCDAATEHAGKLNIIGTFDALRGFEAPISHPQCAIAGRLRFEQIEEGEHRVMLTFADEDGNIVMPKFDSTLAVKFSPGQRTVTSHFVILIQQIQLPKFGEYTIVLAVDGRQLGRFTFRNWNVRRRPENNGYQRVRNPRSTSQGCS